jgi:hypothetical protein
MKAKDPDGFRYVTTRMGFTVMAVYGVTSAIISGFVVWWRKGSRGVPNKSPHATAAAPASRD